MVSEEPLLQNFGLNSSNSSPKKLPVRITTQGKKKPNFPFSSFEKRPKILSEFPFSGKIFIVHYNYSYPMLTKPLEKLRKHLPSNQTLAMTWIELA